MRREADTLARAGFDVEVLCLPKPGGRPGTYERDGVMITQLPATLHRATPITYCLDYGWFFLLVSATLMARHLRRPYAVVQVNTMPDFLVFSAVGPKLLGARVLAHFKEPTPELFETIYRRRGLTNVLARIEQAAIRFADHSLTVTEELRQAYIGRGARADDLSVIRTGNLAPKLVDAPDSAARDTRSFRLICHGTIEERYGLETVVEAAQLLRDEIPGLLVTITGRGGGVDDVTRLIDMLDLHDIVRFEGWVERERLDELLARADAGIIAQRASPYSHLVTTNKMIDYWIFGLPAIASRLRSVSTAHDDNVIEYFEPGNASSLADSIRRLHADPERRDALARNGRIALATNSWDSQKERYLEIVEALIRGDAPVRPAGRDSPV